jgi:hypothetical protein
MMSKGSVLLTADDLLRWRTEDKELDDQIRALQLRRAEVKRKLDAAEVFAEKLSATPDRPTAPPAPSQTPDDDEEGDSAPKALVANLAMTGESLNVKQVRARLIELGFGEKIKTRPNYHYSLVYRLTRRGKLLRRGTKYRAAPISSPEGETEAVGASVRS